MTRTIALLLAFTAMIIQPTQGYRGIVPVVSTKNDVERVLGKPSDRVSGLYHFPDEIVSIAYSRYGCKSPPATPGWPVAPSEGWDVPADTVLAVRVTLRQQIPLASLGIDLTTFKKVRGDSDVASHYMYVDEEAGVTIDLNGDGATETVRAYIYQPQAKFKNLRCTDRDKTVE